MNAPLAAMMAGTPDLLTALGHASGEAMPEWLAAGVLVAIRLSGIMLLAPIFSSSAIAPRIKAAFVIAVTILLTPAVLRIPGARLTIGAETLLGELGAGLAFGLGLIMLNEAMMFAGMLLGMQFSFSLVNLLDPNTNIETPVLGQLLGWMTVLVLIAAGLDRTILLALARSFTAIPVGHAVVTQQTAEGLLHMASGIVLAGLQLAAPVMAAAMTVEITIALIGRLSPQLPAQVLSIPLKTLTSYVVLIGSLAVWPRWIEHRFVQLLDGTSRLLVHG
jgi:flagellar biosynthetic protein FliR